MGTKVFVGNMSFDTTREELQELFAQAGEVTEVVVPTDRMSGRPRGFAFVSFATTSWPRPRSRRSTARSWADATSASTRPRPSARCARAGAAAAAAASAGRSEPAVAVGVGARAARVAAIAPRAAAATSARASAASGRKRSPAEAAGPGRLACPGRSAESRIRTLRAPGAGELAARPRDVGAARPAHDRLDPLRPSPGPGSASVAAREGATYGLPGNGLCGMTFTCACDPAAAARRGAPRRRRCR